MKKPKILRKRYIPNETVDISKDIVLFRDEELLITAWDVIRPREDISRGVSYAFLKEGYKISRFYDKDNNFLYWYTDIINVEYDEEKDCYTLIDLLVDVKQIPGKNAEIFDIDELVEASEKNIITKEELLTGLVNVDKVLKLIYTNNFPPEVCNDEKYLKNIVNIV